MGRQVQSYHKHRHMGSSSSVPAELAQALLGSIDYTLRQSGGTPTNENVEASLRLGQAVLEEKITKAQSMLRLVIATAPTWQTECRRDALRCLRHFLDTYDHLHLAHKGPDDLFYPILIAPPEGIQGIDCCLFMLNILWIENQIMAAFSDQALEQLWDRLPNGTLNQCEHVLLNAFGKALIGSPPESLLFSTEEYIHLLVSMTQAAEDTLKVTANKLCQSICLHTESAENYAKAISHQLANHIGANAAAENIGNLFL